MEDTNSPDRPFKVGVNVLVDPASPDVGTIDLGYWHVERGQVLEVEDGSIWTVIDHDGLKVLLERKSD